MRLTKEQKEAREYFSKMTYWDFKKEVKEKNEDGTEKPVTNPVEIMLAAEKFKNCGMMDGRTCKRICDGAFKVIYGMRRDWE